MSDRGSRLSVLWIFLVVVVGGLTCWALIHFAPTTEPEEKIRAPKIVKVTQLEPRDERVFVVAYGTVLPARQVTIRPEVQGRVVRQHPALAPGGFIAEGEEIVGIDRSDYDLALKEMQAALEEAEFELELEKGRQVVAAREWRLLQGDLPENDANRSLVLREPHLRKARALVAKAQNEIARANLSLSRTSISALFNSMVLEEAVDPGQLVASGTTIATLVGTDEFWIRVSVPVDKLRHIRLPTPEREGAAAKIILEAGAGEPVKREGRIVRLLSDLEPSGRMARVLVSVADPLGINGSAAALPLLIDSYVRVEIDAGVVERALTIDRSAFREGERIWVVDADKRLQIRDVTVLWSRKDTVLIPDAIQPGESLVVSGLRVALPGMEVEPQPLTRSGATGP